MILMLLENLVFGHNLNLDQITPLLLRAQEYMGGVGHLVSATLQTKGLIDQAQMLSENGRYILEWIAALFWLFSVVMSIGAVAVFGEYRKALYFLIGPALFFFMISPDASTDGVSVRIGDRIEKRIGEQKILLQWIGAIGGELNSTAPDSAGLSDPDNMKITKTEFVKISRFFAIFDSVVSEMIQKLVSQIINTNNKDDLRFIARERALNFALMGSSEDEAGYMRLVIKTHESLCSKLMSDWYTAASALTRTYGSSVMSEGDNNSRVKAMQAAHIENAQKWNTTEIPVDAEVQKYLTRKDIKSFDDVTRPYNATCKEVWSWVAEASKKLAEERLKPESFLGVDGKPGNVPIDLALKDVNAALASRSGDPNWSLQSDPLKMPNDVPTKVASAARDVLAMYIYKNTVRNTPAGALQSQVFHRSPFNAQRYDQTMRHGMAGEVHGEFFKLKYFALTIPYIQGLLLYVLSVAFPIFSIFLVMPGRASSFIVWCFLWVWVKSWDVGFALVHVARDILWYLMSSRINVHGVQVNWNEPTSILGIISNNDPLTGQNVYWQIVSLLTCLVPFLTAHLCLGASGMFDMFRGSIDQAASRFAGHEARSGRRREGNYIEDNQQRHLGEGVYALTKFAANRQGHPAFPESMPANMLGEPIAPADDSTVHPRMLESGAALDDIAAHSQLAEIMILAGDRNWFEKYRAGRIQAEKAETPVPGNKDLPKGPYSLFRGMVDPYSKLDPETRRVIYRERADAVDPNTSYMDATEYLQDGQRFWKHALTIVGRRQLSEVNFLGREKGDTFAQTRIGAAYKAHAIGANTKLVNLPVNGQEFIRAFGGWGADITGGTEERPPSERTPLK